MGRVSWLLWAKRTRRALLNQLIPFLILVAILFLTLFRLFHNSLTKTTLLLL